MTMKCKKFSSAFNAYVVQKLKKLKVKVVQVIVYFDFLKSHTFVQLSNTVFQIHHIEVL